MHSTGNQKATHNFEFLEVLTRDLTTGVYDVIYYVIYDS